MQSKIKVFRFTHDEKVGYMDKKFAYSELYAIDYEMPYLIDYWKKK